MKYKKSKWLPVPGYEAAYECSNYGVVRSISKFRIDKNGIKYPIQWAVLSLCKDKDGYMEVDFCENGKKRRWKVHRLVAFLFAEGDSRLDVNHIDYNKLNNYFENLEYKTKAENVAHSARGGRYDRCADHFKKRRWRDGSITVQKDLDGNPIKEWSSLTKAAIDTGYRKTMIRKAAIGKNKTAYGYTWSYKDKICSIEN